MAVMAMALTDLSARDVYRDAAPGTTPDCRISQTWRGDRTPFPKEPSLIRRVLATNQTPSNKGLTTARSALPARTGESGLCVVASRTVIAARCAQFSVSFHGHT
jgi:hypothetical protein